LLDPGYALEQSPRDHALPVQDFGVDFLHVDFLRIPKGRRQQAVQAETVLRSQAKSLVFRQDIQVAFKILPPGGEALVLKAHRSIDISKLIVELCRAAQTTHGPAVLKSALFHHYLEGALEKRFGLFQPSQNAQNIGHVVHALSGPAMLVTVKIPPYLQGPFIEGQCFLVSSHGLA